MSLLRGCPLAGVHAEKVSRREGVSPVSGFGNFQGTWDGARLELVARPKRCWALGLHRPGSTLYPARRTGNMHPTCPIGFPQVHVAGYWLTLRSQYQDNVSAMGSRNSQGTAGRHSPEWAELLKATVCWLTSAAAPSVMLLVVPSVVLLATPSATPSVTAPTSPASRGSGRRCGGPSPPELTRQSRPGARPRRGLCFDTRRARWTRRQELRWMRLQQDRR
jgi:hypothetical protein